MARHASGPATTSHLLWGGAVEVRCHGRSSGNWALRGTSPEEAESANPGIITKIALLARAYRCTILAPHATRFDGALTHPARLHDAWTTGLARGAHADALVLERRGQAFGVGSGDCPTVALRNVLTGATIAAHAGRDCLFDRPRIADGAAPRPHASVIDAMVAEALRGGGDPDDLRAFIACGTGPEWFTHNAGHPTAGERNRRMIAHLRAAWGDRCILGDPDRGRLALSELIRAQLEAHGVHPAHVGHDGVDTYGETDAAGRHVWHSHRRDGDGTRNLVLVIRRW